MTHKERAKILLAQLQDQKLLPANFEIIESKIVSRNLVNYNTNTVMFGSYKELGAFLEGVQYLATIQQQINKI